MRVLLLAALLGAPARGSRILRNPGDGERIDTPFGPMIRADARALCVGKTVYIGVTEDAVAYRVAEKGGGSRVRTQLTVRVERRVVGEPGDFASLDVTGGEIDGKKVWPPVGAPSLDVGIRYLVASVPMLADAPPTYEKGDTLVTLAHPMDADAPLESDEVITASLNALCEREAFQRYDQTVGRATSPRPGLP